MGVCPCFGRRKARKCVRDSYEISGEPKCLTPDSSAVAGLHLDATEISANALMVMAVSSSCQEYIDSKCEMQTTVAEGQQQGQAKGNVFNYRELAAATRNFHPDCFIGEGGFGSVYQGKLERTGQVVAVKKLNPFGLQGDKEFLVEVLMLSLLRHPNLVNMIGYCAEGDQRLLVLEYLPLGSLESHLHDLPPGAEPLDWNMRMKIAAGAARGVDYLHNEARPHVIFRDLKPSNILLDEGFHAKLTDFGLAKFGPMGDNSHVSTRVMGTYGYCAPEYAETGKLTLKSDTFSFGVVLLELITGHRALDLTRKHGRHSLVDWALPLLKDKKHHVQLADPRLEGRFPLSSLHHAFEVAAMCLREEVQARPTMHEVANAMEYLTSRKADKPNSYLPKSNVFPSKDEDSPSETTRMLSKSEREQAVAEAKMWGEKWRDRIRQGGDVGADSPVTEK